MEKQEAPKLAPRIQTDRAKTVYVAALNQGSIRVELARLLAELTHQGKYNVFLSFPADKPIQHNRNRIVADFLSNPNYDYLMMLDGDIIPPVNILDLIDHQKDIIGGLCFAYRDRSIVPLILTEQKKTKEDEGKIEKTSYQIMDVEGNEGLVECDAIGTGCMIIKREILERPEMRYPFKNYYNEDGERILGLDLSFCKRAKDIGYKVWCHLNFACSHWTYMDLKTNYGALMAREEENRVKIAQIEKDGI